MGRVLLRPATSWTGVMLSSVMPLRYRGVLWWLRARITTNFDETGLSLDTVANHIACDGIEFDIEQAAGTGEFHPLAQLTLREVVTSRDTAFDPILHTAPGVQLAPGWLANIRRAAYRRSREGRNAE